MARIASSCVDEITARTDIVALVGEYVRLEKKGSDWWGCCPFHTEKTASFHVLTDRKMYYCFGCGKGGGLINFYMEMEKISFVEAAESLAKKSGVELQYEGGVVVDVPRDDTKERLVELYKRVSGTFHFFLTESVMGKSALEYIKNRGVTDEIVELFNLGYAPHDRRWLFRFLSKKGYSAEFLAQSGLFSKKYPDVSFFSDRLMFPICNRKGQVVAFGGRLLSGDGPKYLNSSEMEQYKKGETLFAFHHALPAIRSEKAVILCEGYMDAIAFHQAEIRNAVAPLGTAFTPEQMQLIRTFVDTVLISFDNDAAGQKATYKAILLCRSIGLTVKVIHLSGGKDPADILLNNGAEVLKKAVECAILDVEYLFAFFSSMYSIETPEGKTRAIHAFFPYIDILDSDIQKEASLEAAARFFNVNLITLYTDYRKGIRQKTTRPPGTNTQVIKVIRRTAELRAVLAVIVNLEYFVLMRSSIQSDDFEDMAAKELFIVLEECFREERLTYEGILQHCTHEELKNIVIETVTSGEFAENFHKVIEDGIRHIKRNNLERRKIKLVNKMRQIQGLTLEEQQQLTDLITEKMNIDTELQNL